MNERQKGVSLLLEVKHWVSLSAISLHSIHEARDSNRTVSSEPCTIRLSTANCFACAVAASDALEDVWHGRRTHTGPTAGYNFCSFRVGT